jgi:hypothetical protein
MVDHSTMRLGRKPRRHDPRAPRLARYLAGIPAAPDIVDYTGRLTSLGMMANDRLGDCTCAAIGHAIQTWTSQARSEITLGDGDVIALYERFGYDPANPASDQGAVIADVLNSWLAAPVAGHAIDGWAAVDAGDVEEVLAGIYLFGGLDIGLALPLSAQTQEIWDVPAAGPRGAGQPGSWGGHCVWVAKGERGAGFTCITWGGLKRMTLPFWQAYCDEANAVLSQDWSGAEGFDYAQLRADMATLKVAA